MCCIGCISKCRHLNKLPTFTVESNNPHFYAIKRRIFIACSQSLAGTWILRSRGWILWIREEVWTNHAWFEPRGFGAQGKQTDGRPSKKNKVRTRFGIIEVRTGHPFSRPVLGQRTSPFLQEKFVELGLDDVFGNVPDRVSSLLGIEVNASQVYRSC